MLRVFLVAALVLAGCGGGGDDQGPTENPDPVCEAGRVVSCPCADGEEATQVCADDGSKWGTCACAAPPAIDPSDQCSLPQDQSTFMESERCPAKQIMYAKCDRAVVTDGVCTEKPFGVFCCPKG